MRDSHAIWIIWCKCSVVVKQLDLVCALSQRQLFVLVTSTHSWCLAIAGSGRALWQWISVQVPHESFLPSPLFFPVVALCLTQVLLWHTEVWLTACCQRSPRACAPSWIHDCISWQTALLRVPDKVWEPDKLRGLVSRLLACCRNELSGADCSCISEHYSKLTHFSFLNRISGIPVLFHHWRVGDGKQS